MRRLVLILLAISFAVIPASASAAWTRFTPPASDSVNAPMGVVRTADGTLHVLWLANVHSQSESLMHTSFSAAGSLGATTTVSSDWATIDPPGVVTGGDGASLHAFWGGQHNNDSTHQELNYAYSTDGGATWTLAPYNLLTGEQVGIGTMGAARLGSTFFQSWGSYVHAGNSAGPGHHLTASPADDCCGYDADIAADPVSGLVLAAWFSNQTNYDGVYVQQINPVSGAPNGSPVLVPGTAGVGSALEPAAVIARPGQAGFVVAYGSGSPVATRMLVWPVGRPSPFYLGTSEHDVFSFALAAAGDARVWAVWKSYNHGVERILARRSNPTVTAWGSPVSVATPQPGHDVWTLSANTIGGALDILVSAGDQGAVADYQTRLLPGLTLTSSRSRLSRKKRQKVTFSVQDAGAPVKGATVRAAGRSGVTSASGRVKLGLGPFASHVHRIVVKVRAAGYASTSIILRVR